MSKKKKLILEYIGMNAAGYPVYQDQHEKLWIAITVCYFLCLKFGDVITWIIIAVCFLYLLFMVMRFLKLLKENEDNSEDTVGPFGNNEGEKK